MAVNRSLMPGMGTRALLLAIGCTLLCSLWVRQAEVVVVTTKVTESVPTIPAVIVLLTLALLNRLVQRIEQRLQQRMGKRMNQRWSLSRAELATIYMFIAVSTTIMGCGIAAFFLSTITSVVYFADAQNQYEQLARAMPSWLVIKDEEIVKGFYEGVNGGGVAWGAWIVPLTCWSILLASLWFAIMALMVLLYGQWSHRERLLFPLLELPLRLTEESASSEGRPSGVPALIRDPVMWIGFGISAVFHGLNILHALNPSVTAPGRYYPLGSLFTERPLDALSPVALWYRLEMIGFTYFVSTEVSFSTWLFYWLQRAAAVVARSVGYEQASFPFEHEQSLGAYVALAMVLLWMGRGHIAEVVESAIGRAGGNSFGNRQPIGFILIGGLVGFITLFTLCESAGIPAWVVVLYFALILLVAITYARVRVEAGAAQIWLFPYYEHYRFIFNAFGSAPFQGNPSGLSSFALLIFLSRGYFPTLGAYQMESFKISEHVGLRPNQIFGTLIAALAIGVGVGYWLYLKPGYEFGANVLRAGGGMWGTGINIEAYNSAVSLLKNPTPPDVSRVVATGLGAVVVLLLTIMRTIYLHFPLHPLGYCMATSYGSVFWFSFFLVWLIKVTVLKVGGIQLHRRLLSAFIGLVLGDFIVAGVLWGSLGIYFGEEVFLRYRVWYG